MEYQELKSYFDDNIDKLPDSIRLGPGTVQHDVAKNVLKLLDLMKDQPKVWQWEHRLKRIMTAYEDLKNQ